MKPAAPTSTTSGPDTLAPGSRTWLRNALALTLILLFAFYALLALDSSRSIFHFMSDPQSAARTEQIRHAADAGIEVVGTPEAQVYLPLWIRLMGRLTDSRFAYDSDSLARTETYYAAMPSSHQWVLGLHMLLGGLCMLLGGTQFWPWFRRQHPVLHRRFGMVFVATAQLAMIMAVIYLTVTGVANTYSQLTFHIGLWFLATLVSLSLWLAIWHVKRREIAQHLGWMAMAYGLLLSAPFTRYDWVAIGMLFPESSFNEANYGMMGMLMAQCIITAYLLLCVSRWWSRPRAALQARPWADNMRAALPRYLPWLSLIFVAMAATVVFFYLLTPSLAHSVLAVRMIPAGLLGNEAAVFDAALPSRAVYTVVTTGTLLLAPVFMRLAFRQPLNAARLPASLRTAALALALATGLAALLQCKWAWALGGPSHATLAGGTFYLLTGGIELMFAILLSVAVLRQRLALVKEWGLFAILAATLAPAFYWMLALLDLTGIPAHYLATGHGYSLAIGLASALPLLPGFVYAVYGSASRERIAY